MTDNRWTARPSLIFTFILPPESGPNSGGTTAINFPVVNYHTNLKLFITTIHTYFTQPYVFIKSDNTFTCYS